MTNPSGPTCFLISRIGEPGTAVRAQADDFREFIVKQCDGIKDGEYNVVRADDIHEPGRITVQVIRRIVESELVIADVTGANPNVYYELAVRHAIDKPVIICAEIGTQLPFDTRDNRTIFYSLYSRQAVTARDDLSKQIVAIKNSGFVADNPLYEVMALLSAALSKPIDGGSVAGIMAALNSVVARLGAVEQTLRAQVVTDYSEALRRAIARTDINALYPYADQGLLSEVRVASTPPNALAGYGVQSDSLANMLAGSNAPKPKPKA